MTKLFHIHLGDDTFPLRTNLMKPHGRRGLRDEMMVVNYCISSRMVQTNDANHWRCFLSTMEQCPDTLGGNNCAPSQFPQYLCPSIGNAEVDREVKYYELILGARRGEKKKLMDMLHPT